MPVGAWLCSSFSRWSRKRLAPVRTVRLGHASVKGGLRAFSGSGALRSALHTAPSAVVLRDVLRRRVAGSPFPWSSPLAAALAAAVPGPLGASLCGAASQGGPEQALCAPQWCSPPAGFRLRFAFCCSSHLGPRGLSLGLERGPHFYFMPSLLLRLDSGPPQRHCHLPGQFRKEMKPKGHPPEVSVQLRSTQPVCRSAGWGGRREGPPGLRVASLRSGGLRGTARTAWKSEDGRGGGGGVRHLVWSPRDFQAADCSWALASRHTETSTS